MEYRGKQYTIVQGIGPDSWKWKVHLDLAIPENGRACDVTHDEQTNCQGARSPALKGIFV
jgi:hypothetical protein